ncbi:universal stress protein [Natrarchaeobaculum sulfurireducens]|uniref:Nucleotide-binding protein, UspA family n=1 Tax=Natrarchaeobaculum sulfurireducens TaxID=2044521 RepID=A0A346PC45_9EURY|nr:universal stress protein [Natrarchaeobaculum sulfurireducens]AXR77090.1 Nucleotide-binding protein, UspA family [Natrarchaeobaculum sulfurireducens]AXR82944.1 Universal stress protein [Natrarchaeobaculum sulfurireducens]
MFHALIPVDDDERRAIEQVETVRSLPGGPDEKSATILHVIEEIETPPDEAGPTLIEDLNESLPELQGLPDSVITAERRLEDAGIETDRQQMVGDTARSILQTAAETDADAIVLGARKRTPVGKALFGSVSQKVIRETDRTVIVGR